MRGRILRRFKHPHTVAEVAEALGVPVTRLYHHVNRLAEDGLIHVVATRQVAAVTERRYQVTARSFRLADSLFDTLDRHELALAMASVFDLAKFELMRLVETGGLEQIEQSRDESVISLGELHLTAERRAELVERLNSLFEEFRPAGTAEGGDTAPYNLFIAGFPEARPD